jgi:pimeloyl-ACP methyl ester carboxylesterase
MLKHVVLTFAALGAVMSSPAAAGPPKHDTTIVLVHGAFADASSWNAVAKRLRSDGYEVVAAANPLRSVASDAAYIGRIVASVHGPVVLVGHSYGGSVISQTPAVAANVRALVYVAAFAPDEGEKAIDLTGRLAGTLGTPVVLPDGSKDLYIDQSKFPAQFAADVPDDEAALMAVSQRPVTDRALGEPSGAPAWKRLPSWSIYGSADRNIPPAAMAFMAKRAGSKTTVVAGGSHVLMISHPDEVTSTIEAAAK